MRKTFLFLILCYYPFVGFAQGIYCPQNHGYVKIGMTKAQVVSACGKPQLKQDSENTKITAKIPVKQLVYTTLNRGSVFSGLNSAIYDQWSLPSGSQGVTLEFDIVEGKVSGMRMNGASNNAITVCGGAPISIGADEVAVYNACGNPGVVNNTYVNKSISSSQHPEVWTYKIDQYQPKVRMTFVNGKLEIIER